MFTINKSTLYQSKRHGKGGLPLWFLVWQRALSRRPFNVAWDTCKEDTSLKEYG